MQMMWHMQQELLPQQQGVKVRLFGGERPFSFADVLLGWQADTAFRTFFLAKLTAVAPHLAAFLRNAPISQQEALLQKIAEVVLAEVGERPLWIRADD